MAGTTTKTTDVLLDAVADIIERDVRALAEALSVLPREKIKAMLMDANGDAASSLFNATAKPAVETPATQTKVYRERRPNKLTAEDKAELRRLRAKDKKKWTLQRLGDKFGVSTTSIRYALGKVQPSSLDERRKAG